MIKKTESITIDEWNNVVKRICECCSFKEEIEFDYLEFDHDKDEEYMNCHFVESCPKCNCKYDLVLDNGWCHHGEEVYVDFINYRKAE